MRFSTALGIAAFASLSLASPIDVRSNATVTTRGTPCFPALGFTPPQGVPTTPVSSWWCDENAENGFFGFSYAVNDCPAASKLQADFSRMRQQFHARYVRLYAACDRGGFMDDVVNAAYHAGIGVYSMVWFGFDGGNAWKGRLNTLLSTIQNNPLGKYVIKSIDIGSEPLFDYALSASQLLQQVNSVKSQVGKYGIKVSISEMQYGFVERQGEGSLNLLHALDDVHAHELPFFDQNAKDGSDAWPSLQGSVQWFLDNTNHGKKIIFTQTGWPSNTNIWKPNSPSAVASVAAESHYYSLLDSHCEQLKQMTPLGGVGWFWQIWSDEQLDGWGVVGHDGNPKFNFAPKVNC